VPERSTDSTTHLSQFNFTTAQLEALATMRTAALERVVALEGVIARAKQRDKLLAELREKEADMQRFGIPLDAIASVKAELESLPMHLADHEALARALKLFGQCVETITSLPAAPSARGRRAPIRPAPARPGRAPAVRAAEATPGKRIGRPPVAPKILALRAKHPAWSVDRIATEVKASARKVREVLGESA
jgi:hypothetical protein